jgi:hypothetical protein
VLHELGFSDPAVRLAWIFDLGSDQFDFALGGSITALPTFSPVPGLASWGSFR